MMSRLVIVSNRLPVSISRQDNDFMYSESVGGVATGISSLSEPKERLWFGWPGLPSDKLTLPEQSKITKELKTRGCHPVFLSHDNIQDFYCGFSNNTIWPLFHYFPEITVFDEAYWQSYKDVNRMFCDEISKYITEDDIIWIHDYQLMLLPQMIREKFPQAQIGFFLHIPFPSFELIRNLPWRMEMLEGILGADLIGFHEYDYVRHFLSSIYRICGHDHNLGKLLIGNRHIRVDAFPMGINYEKYAESHTNPVIQNEAQLLKYNKTKIILSVDRLDYTKGILNRLEAYDLFLTKYPEFRGQVTLVMVVVPSRTEVEQYDLLREQIEKYVSRINGTYSTLDWTPISYMYRSLPFEKLSAIYNIADAALITPLRDGMNLVAKEFVATQNGKKHQGMLILSEMAGAACELSEAVVVNPHDKEQIVSAIKEVLEMSQEERLRRNILMQSRLSRYTVSRWANDFISSLAEVRMQPDCLETKQFTQILQMETIKSFSNSEKRLIILDYDGTLAPFSKLPEDAKPNKEILKTLAALCDNQQNTVVIVSGRDKETLTKWLGHLPLNLVAEHGAFYQLKGDKWKTRGTMDNQWKEAIHSILELSVDRTPGSFIEEKKSALVWHFRKSDPDLAKLRTQELKDTLVMMVSNMDIGVFEGNKIIEVKPIHINKGQAVRHWLSQTEWPFIFCAGDDYTDEDMFSALPQSAISCKIGAGQSNAKFRLTSPDQLQEYLRLMSGK